MANKRVGRGYSWPPFEKAFSAATLAARHEASEPQWQAYLEGFEATGIVRRVNGSRWYRFTRLGYEAARGLTLPGEDES